MKKNKIVLLCLTLLLLISLVGCNSEKNNLKIVNKTNVAFSSYTVITNTTQYQCAFEDNKLIEPNIETDLKMLEGTNKEITIIIKDSNKNTIMEETIKKTIYKEKLVTLNIIEKDGKFLIEK